jgi:hypothetical protein
MSAQFTNELPDPDLYPLRLTLHYIWVRCTPHQPAKWPDSWNHWVLRMEVGTKWMVAAVETGTRREQHKYSTTGHGQRRRRDSGRAV